VASWELWCKHSELWLCCQIKAVFFFVFCQKTAKMRAKIRTFSFLITYLTHSQMALEIVGKLIKVLPEVSGQSQKGPWMKQEFVLETLDSQYPKKVCMTAWGEKVNDLKQFATGDTLKATFSAESREYNERWYTELRAFRIDVAEGEEAAPAAPAAGGYVSRPAQSAPASAPNKPAAASFNSAFDDDESNDLPF